MSDFVNYLFHYLGRAAIVVVFVLALAAAVLGWAVKRHKKKYGPEVPFPWGKTVLTLMLAVYLVVLLFVTVGRGASYYRGGGNFHLFRAWREAWNSFSEKNWLNVLLNIAMFVPLGILLPALWKRLRRWYWMLPAGVGFSLYIEVVQYLKGSGLFDVDDLFCNTLGAMIGFWLMMVFLSVRGREWKRGLCHGLMLTATAASIGGIFLAYALQEYGNLSTSPAYRVDTSDVEWTVSCELSEEERTVSVYQTRTWSKAECEAFGRQFFEELGIAEVDVTIYNEEVYLREHLGNRILEVYFKDGSFAYNDLDSLDHDSTLYVRTEEQTIRAELLKYGIQIPEEAEISYDGDGYHSFVMDRCVEGDTMTDGILTCRYEEDFGIREISNCLVTFQYYKEAEIISPAAAVERLKAGWLASGDWLQRLDPDRLEVVSCELSYQVDTKGFYQPVYLVKIQPSGTDDWMHETVPALK